MTKRNKIWEYIIVFSIFVMVFISYLFSTFLSFFDEFFAGIILLLILYKIGYSKIIYLYREEKIIFVLLSFIGFWGLLSNYLTTPKHITDSNAIISDFIVVFKAYVVYFGIRLLNVQIDSKVILNKISFFAEILFYLLAALVIIDLFFDVFPKEPRYGMKAFQLFFNHPSRYSFAFSFIFLSVFHKYIDEKKWFLLIILLFGLLSLRVKYFGFVTIAFLVFYFKDYLKRIPKKQFFFYIIILFSLLFILFKEQIGFYFSLESLKTGWSRAVLLVKSFEIGNDFFPFGTGFGTYAGYFSGKYYSWVYDLYGISNVYGISRTYTAFISDQFWPMVLGQFGYLGLLAYGWVLYLYIMLFLKLLKDNTKSWLSQRLIVALLGLFLLIIDSTADAIFTQDRAVVIFVLIALIVNLQSNKFAYEQK